jgi:Dockerin type I domain
LGANEAVEKHGLICDQSLRCDRRIADGDSWRCACISAARGYSPPGYAAALAALFLEAYDQSLFLGRAIHSCIFVFPSEARTMAKHRTKRQAARRNQAGAHSRTGKLIYRRKLRYEPLEDRRLLALVTVDTLADTVDFGDGLTSLREAIFATNLVGGADTIDFAPSLTAGGPASIVLTQGELRITDALSIYGPGADLLSIDASGSDPTPEQDNGDGSRVFSVFGQYPSVSPSIIISGIKLTGGDANGLGGAVNGYFADIAFDNMAFSDNFATLYGGAVFTILGNLQLDESTVTSNASKRGGGVVVVDGNLTIDHSIISDNVAPTGGGIYFLAYETSAIDLLISDTDIARNQSSIAGAGIWAKLDGGSLSLRDSKITENVIEPSMMSAGRGGGIYAHTTIADVLITGTDVYGNRAAEGGGVWLWNTDGTFTVSQAYISENTAFGNGRGGGMYLLLGDTQTAISETTIRKNLALEGGGIWLTQSGGGFSFSESEISNNHAIGEMSRGAGLLIFGQGFGLTSSGEITTVPIIHQSVISGNVTAGLGGGIFSDVPIEFRHSTISNNTASRGGGMHGGAAILDHTIVAGNLATETSNDLNNTAVTARYSLIGDINGVRRGVPIRETPNGIPDANGNIIGGPMHGVIDPLLGPLADNGGSTLTHALLPGSPAINRGDLNAVAGASGVPLYDQRGVPFARVVGGRIDIGAFEYQTATDLNLLVDTLADELDGDYSRGDLSLREALALSYAPRRSNVPDTIRFDPALAGGTIMLTMGELQILDHVAIIGLGADQLTIDASGLDATPGKFDGRGKRIFNILGNQGAPLNVSMSGLTLTGGDSGPQGGAIATSGAHLTLETMEIRGNASRENGGAIFASMSTLTLDSTTVADNNANGRGGGLFMANGSLFVEDSTISGNKAMIGGGIYFLGLNPTVDPRLTIARSVITGNSATRDGGGIWARLAGGSISLAHSSVTDNTAGQSTPTMLGRGGGIYADVFQGAATITSSEFRDNVASEGGGARLRAVGGEVLFTDSDIGNNFATGAEGRGGGLHLSGQAAAMTMRGTGVGGNVASGTFGRGGGMYVDGNPLVVELSSISGNTAGRYGGGIYSRSPLELRDSQMTHNVAQRGGAIDSTSLVITGGGLADNEAVGSGGLGGAIYHGGGMLTITEANLFRNVATASGGAIYVGGRSETAALIERSTIEANAAGSQGGGITSFFSPVTLVGSTLSGNKAGFSGGGVFGRGAPVNMRHSTVFQNIANQLGGGVQLSGGSLVLDHSIVAGNVAQGEPRDIGGAAVSSRHSLIGTNQGLLIGDNNNQLGETPNHVPDSQGNLVGGPVNGVIDPLLGPLADNGGPTLTHALLPGSPAINRGDLNAIRGENGVPLFDQRGEPFNRIVGGRIDIGAFEYQQPANLNLFVDTLADESDGDYGRGDLSLREAIELAEQWPGVDTIHFDPALAGGTIVLTMGELQIHHAVSIIGLGSQSLTVDASGNDLTPDVKNGDGSRIFHLLDGTIPPPGVVEISGLTLTGGDVAGDGGAMNVARRFHGRDLVLTGNSATRNGGAMWVQFHATLEQSVIAHNHASVDGGGLSGGTQLKLSDVSILENTAGEDGGGIRVFTSSQVEILDSSISGNTAGRNGGGLYSIRVSTISIDGSTISNNMAGMDGGGLAFVADVTTISRSAITNNVAGRDGGGIASRLGSLNVSQSTIAGNRTEAGNGGGIVASSSSLMIADSTIANNKSANSGGGIVVAPTPGLISSVIRQSTISGNSARTNGGGIFASVNSTAPLAIQHSTITGNMADSDSNGFGAESGGGIFVIGNGVLTLDHSIVARNFAPSHSDITRAGDATIAAGFSLIGTSAGSGLTPATGVPDANGNIIGGTVNRINPLLGPLANNGGPTFTHALLPGSPAINMGDPSLVAGAGGVPVNDQRGAPFTRVYEGRIDIGAFELQPPPFVLGDFNRDGTVNTADYVVWRKQMGTVGEPGAGADANGDGVVDAADYAVWRNNLGQTSAAPPATDGELGAGSMAQAAVMEANYANEPQASRVAVSRSAIAAEIADAALVDWVTTRSASEKGMRRLERWGDPHTAGNEADEPAPQLVAVFDRAFERLGAFR